MKNKQLQFTYLSDKPSDKFKRIIWLGQRSKLPGLGSKMHANTEKTLQKEIEDVNSYPVLVVWETDAGAKSYAAIKAF
jgi:hypothetical protein